MAEQAPFATSAERGQRQRMPADAGQWICALRGRRGGYVCYRSQPARGLRAGLAFVSAARSSLGACADRHLSGNQGDARDAGVSSQLRIPLERRIHARLARSGFVYRTSNGNSTREAGQVQLRRRLRSGFTASVDYTYAKAMDDDAQVGAQGHVTATICGGDRARRRPQPTVAQNWLDLRAERELSTFDQRQLLNAADSIHDRNGHGRPNPDERMDEGGC